MVQENRSYLTRLAIVCVLILLSILVISALRGVEHPFSYSNAATSKSREKLPDYRHTAR